RHDVPVVPVRDGDEGGRLFDPGGPQHVLVDPSADEGLAAEVGGQPPERARLDVDDGHVVPVVVEDGGNAGADATATHDDDSHSRIVSSRQSGCARRTTITSHGAFLST